ncbi:L-arabinokinase [Ceratobasidium sp. AG-Ba]|nr:L-arabinokinase [Ceratobasidium sp. AG-Ba]
MARNIVAYYCSGHGYGHATRVSAFTKQLLELGNHFEVHIVSSAPSHIFSDCLKASEHCHYRYAEIDPVVVQPLAYRVDRDKSVQVLERFLRQRDAKIAQELEWLNKTRVTCVLSDSAFLACAAANAASLPCALVTNFTFDSVYSYLGTLFIDESPSTQPSDTHLDKQSQELPPDIPIPESVLAPLVQQIVTDYRCADLLLRLPGAIPIPSFSPTHPLPAPDWVSLDTCRFKPERTIPVWETKASRKGDAASTVAGPTPDPGRRSFPAARVHWRAGDIPRAQGFDRLIWWAGDQAPDGHAHSLPRPVSEPLSAPGTPSTTTIALQTPRPQNAQQLHAALASPHRIATPSHIYVPGAPPASNPTSPMISNGRQGSLGPGPTFSSFFTPPTPATEDRPMPLAPGAFIEVEQPKEFLQPPPSHLLPTPDDSNPASPTEELGEPDLFTLLPDGWIAIEDLPDRFFVAPRDVYMPDVTAVGDVLLGKLGYGTCAECVDSCTPFVYVPRACVCEHGLRMLMETAGTGVELPRERYEAGDWASTIERAWELGKDKKIARRLLGARGDARRRRQVEEMAREFEAWLGLWN